MSESLTPLVAQALAAADERLPSPLEAVVFLGVGLLTLYGAYAAWTGHWRSWMSDSILLNGPLTLLPSFGFMCVGGGIAGIYPSTLTAVLGAPLFAVGLLLIPLIVFFVLDFDWFGPRYYRDHKRAERQLRREERARRRAKRALRKRTGRSPVGDVGGPEA